jgi:hypothetical protein
MFIATHLRRAVEESNTYSANEEFGLAHIMDADLSMSRTLLQGIVWRSSIKTAEKRKDRQV